VWRSLLIRPLIGGITTMASKFCLPKELADKLHQLAVEGKIDIAKMYAMTPTERGKLFEGWVDPLTARNLNLEFTKAMVSPQKVALQKFVKRYFSGTGANKTKAKGLTEKIDTLDETGPLTPTNEDIFLRDFIAIDLGITVSTAEASAIVERATKLEALAPDRSEFGTPTIEYFKAKQEMENYLRALDPSSRVKVSTSISGRGAMLFSVKSPFLNIESNTIQALLTSLERRILGIGVSPTFIGKNTEYARNYAKFAFKVFKETGYDLTRMRTLQGTSKVRGEYIETHSQGKGLARKIGRFYEDVVFKNLMSAPDVAFAGYAFSDSANLASTTIAKQEGLKGKALEARSLEIFKDATRVDPKTKEGLKVREQGIADAEYATYTNKSKSSDFAMGIRKTLNLVSGDIRLGDLALPFVKTPANVIQAGLDFSGITLAPDFIIRTSKMINEIRKGETLTEASQRSFDGVAKVWVRAGMGLVLAQLLTSLFDPEDFIGEYPVSQKERELLKARNATTNSVRIGDRWISLDYFAVLGAPLVGMLYAKKYGDTTRNKIFNYHLGVIKQASKVPGLELTGDIWQDIDRMRFNDFDNNLKATAKMITDFVNSRTVPALLYDMAKMTDVFERQTDREKPITGLQTKIPFWREGLPEKESVFGEKIKTEAWWSTLLFGSRVKTESQSGVVKEMVRLYDSGNLPSITDSAKTSPRMDALKTQIGESKFKEATSYFRETYSGNITKEMKKSSYKKISDEEKAKRLEKIKDEALEKTLKKFKYKKDKKKVLGGKR